MGVKPKPTWTTYLKYAGTLLSLGLLVWLLWKQDWQILLASIEQLSIAVLLSALALALCGQVWNACRWWILLRGQKISLGFLQAAKLTFAGLFASNFLPGTIGGDVVRVLGVMPRSGSRVAGAASVIVDRVISVFGMLFILPFSWPIVNEFIANQHEEVMIGFISWGSIFSALPERLKRALKRLQKALLIWAKNPLSLFMALVASWIGVALYLLAVWLVARDLGIAVSLIEVAGATGLSYFATMIPISISGYGIRELMVFGLYTQLGATPEQAAALALITRIILLLVSLPGAFWLGAAMDQTDLANNDESTEKSVHE